jgi:AcrR family transcriptional regulator
MATKNRRGDVLDAANRVFLRFGYRRTTMGDIAEEANISRPALYLVFPSKEKIFSAVLGCVLHAELDEIRVKIAKQNTTAAKLILALEVWCVRNYELTNSTVGATDLYENSFAFANEVAVKSTAEFETILAQILKLPVQGQSRLPLTATELARLISSASVGFKSTAKGAKELRASLRGLVAVVLASLDEGP